MSYQLFRKFALPETEFLVEKSFYIVSEEGSSKAELYYVGADKSVKTFLNEQGVTNLIQSLTHQSLYVCDTIEDRDNLGLTHDSLVVVINDPAQGEEEVPGLYLFVVSIEHFILLNASHSHSNLPALNAITEDEEGRLLYKGNLVSNVILSGSQW